MIYDDLLFFKIWLVVLTIWKNISQWKGLSHISWKKNVWNHQPDTNGWFFQFAVRSTTVFDVKNHPRSETPLSSSSSSRSDAMEDRSSPTCGITRQKSRRFFSHRKSDETGMACLFKRTPYNTMILHGFPVNVGVSGWISLILEGIKRTSRDWNVW